MSRHRLWEADEVLERITAEFDEGIADIDDLVAACRDQEKVNDDLIRLGSV